MRDPSVRAILGVGAFVLVAQLVVWLTPARNLIIDSSQNRALLDQSATRVAVGGKSAARVEPVPVPAAEEMAQPTGRPEPKAENQSSPPRNGEPPVAPQDAVAQAQTSPEQGDQTSVAPISGEETAALPVPHGEGDADGRGDEAPAPPGETTAEAPDGAPAPSDGAAAQATTSREPGAEDKTSLTGDGAPVPANEAMTPAPAPPQQGAESPETEPEPPEDTAAQPPALPGPTTEGNASVEGAPAPTQDTAALATRPKLEGQGDASRPVTEQAPAPQEDSAPPALPQPVLIGDTIRRKLNDSALRKGAHADDLAALEAFYAGDNGPAHWVTSEGLTPKAQAIIAEINKADDWGLDASAFQVPPPDFRPTTAEDQAAAEVALDLAILKYARLAQGGGVDPAAVSSVFDVKPSLRDPATILTDIVAAPAPDAYLRDLHPKHPQFERLRQALIKARAEGDAKLEELNKLRANMERWRWMPADLGKSYVWLNIPELTIRVVKRGTVTYSDRVVIGSPSDPTPVVSADLKSIVFNPSRVVPLSVIRKNVLPALQKDRSWFGGSKTSVLKQYQLEVKRNGKTIDPTKIDWQKVDLTDLTFVQAPGPTNVLGKVQFLFPNPRGVDLHETIDPDRLGRAMGEDSPRVGSPDKLADVLLAEDKGWGAAKIAKLIADGKTAQVNVDHTIPVHLTYFTAVADADGKVSTFADVYGLDAAVEGAMLKQETAASGVAESTSGTAEPAPVPQRKPSANGGLAASGEN